MEARLTGVCSIETAKLVQSNLDLAPFGGPINRGNMARAQFYNAVVDAGVAEPDELRRMSRYWWRAQIGKTPREIIAALADRSDPP